MVDDITNSKGNTLVSPTVTTGSTINFSCKNHVLSLYKHKRKKSQEKDVPMETFP